MTRPATRRSIVFKTAGALAFGLLFGACGKKEPETTAASAPAATTAAANTAPAKVVMVGTDAAYAPFEYQNEKGDIIGLTVDVVTAAAARSGIGVKFVNTPWEGIFNALQQGDRDMLASSITITEERKQTMDFTDSYFDAAQLIAVRQDSKVARFDDLKKLKVGVQTGTTGDEVVSKLLGKTNTNVRRFESTPLALKELESSGVDAVVADNGVVVNYVNNNAGSKFKTVSDSAFAAEHYGFAVKKGNADLLAKLNKGLADIKADGSYDKIYAKYFGTAMAAGGAASATSK